MLFRSWPYVALAFQPWLHNGKPSILIRDQVKYYRVDPVARVVRQAEWNKPTWWPVLLLAAGALALVWVGRRSYRARQDATAKAAASDLAPQPSAQVG